MTFHAPASTRNSDSMEWISDAAFADLSQLVEKKAGIVLSDGKRSLAVSRLSRRVSQLGLSGFEAYCELLVGPNGSQELQEMIRLLTTNVTRFFREPHHFDRLRDVLLARQKNDGPIRLWSAGCSSGEEAYSMAMVVLEAIPDRALSDIKILATDIDRDVLKTARAGCYSSSLGAQIDPHLAEKYFTPRADMPGIVQVQPHVRTLVQFAELNLLDAWPMKGQFDVIFCRNVVIYFSQETQAALWPRFAGALRAGGHLMIGHSERVTGPGAAMLQSNGVTQYKRIS